MADITRVSIVANTNFVQSPLTSTSTVYEASRVVKVGRGTLYGFSGYNSKASAQFILIFDAIGVPATGAIPTVTPIAVGATTNFSMLFNDLGRPFLNGIVFCNSSTANTLTAGSADCWFDVEYIQVAFLSTSPAVPDQAGQSRVARVTITFTGAANLGAVGNLPLFTVSGGLIAIEEIYGRCTTSLTSAGGTITLGVTGQTTLFIGLTTASTLTTAAELWVSTTATAAGILIPAADKQALIDANVVGTVATAVISAGVLEIDCLWHPVSAGATLA